MNGKIRKRKNLKINITSVRKLTWVSCINSSQWRSVIAGFCNSVMVRNDATNSLRTPTIKRYGDHSRMLLSSVRKSRVNCLHSFSMSSVSMSSQGDARQSLMQDSMTWTKSHSCCCQVVGWSVAMNIMMFHHYWCTQACTKIVNKDSAINKRETEEKEEYRGSVLMSLMEKHFTLAYKKEKAGLFSRIRQYRTMFGYTF